MICIVNYNLSEMGSKENGINFAATKPSKLSCNLVLSETLQAVSDDTRLCDGLNATSKLYRWLWMNERVP